ncbi:hypothetical protein [Endozoicomonas sp.]|uniref:hypothetical protein n=1 Tax=Endozoicomonas sp. TaxID=1892382 RepID=UPI002886AB03|nr:hypothetical protein [Endozoicomonas sp.]
MQKERPDPRLCQINKTAETSKMILLNNCKGSDINAHGSDYSMKFSEHYAPNKNRIKVGSSAVIVRFIEDGLYEKKVIKITELGRATEDGVLLVTVFGDVHSSEVMTKAELTKDKFTAKFFDKNGRFKQRSVI